MTQNGSFLSRWSRLKRGQAKATSPAAGTDPASARLPTADDLATLGAHSDFRPFLLAGVDPDVRVRALRVLWACDPSLSRLDGLIDYAGDYTGAGDAKPGTTETIT